MIAPMPEENIDTTIGTIETTHSPFDKHQITPNKKAIMLKSTLKFIIYPRFFFEIKELLKYPY